MLRTLRGHCGISKPSLGKSTSSRSKHRQAPPPRRLLLESLEDRLVLDGEPIVDELILLNDTGESASDRITTDATVTGSVRNDGVNSFLRVEFDWNGDGTADGVSGTDLQGRFVYRPDGLNVGAITLRARAGRPIEGELQYEFGAWTSLSFTLQAAASNTPAAIGTLAIQFDTGMSGSDGVTNDPTLAGAVTDDGSVFGLLLEFDQNADGIVDGTTRTDRDGYFTFTPANLTSGPSTISARVREWDAAQSTFLYSSWTPVTFTLDSTANVAPEVAVLNLFRDTLDSTTDGITTDPRLSGAVSNDGRVQGLVVEFDHNGDGTVDGSAYTGPTGQFWYLPKGLDTGTFTLRARPRESLYGQTESVTGSWSSLAFTLVDDPNNAVAQVTELVLQEDTGLSNSDGITGDPRLRGTVTNDNQGFVKVQFDHDGDGIPDAEEYTDLAGSFSYTPLALSIGPVTIQARAVEWSVDRFADIHGPWLSVTFDFDPSQNLPAVLSDVQLQYDTGDEPDDLITSDTTLTGSVANDGNVATVAVEFDVDGDDRVDGSTMVNSAATFSWSPSGLLEGERTIRTRAREWIPGQSPAISAWASITFTLDSSADLAPVVASLALFNDTGESDTDGITRDARVTGSVTDDGRLADHVVQFDHDGDGNLDGSTSSDTAGGFRYTPIGLSDGPVTILARGGQVGPGGAVSNLGEWVALSFTLESQVGNNPPSISAINLLRDTGASNTDTITTDPRIRGTVTHEQVLNDLRVEFNHGTDGFADGFTTTDSDGEFVYTPNDVNAGNVTFRARAGEKQSDESYDFGQWVSFSLTLEAGSENNLPPVVFKIKLENDTGSSSTDRITLDPTLSGVITNDDAVDGLTVEFDHDDDGTVDGTTTTDSVGWFTYEPEGLQAGQVTMRARATEWDPATSLDVVGDWLSFAFTLENPPAEPAPDPDSLPEVSNLKLLNDTGSSATDSVTTDPAVTGTVINVSSGDRTIVEFDHGTDEMTDGSVTPDRLGDFKYMSDGLPAGNVTVRARAGVWDADASAYLFGAWTSLSFTLDADPINMAPSVTSLMLVYDTGTSNSDTITSDPTVSGSISDNGRVEWKLVEFDQNNDGIVDASVRTNDQGNFMYTPLGLASGAATIRARAGEWDPGQTAYIFGGWTQLSFTLDSSANLVPSVASLALMRDTGSSSSDGVTSESAMTGTVADDGELGGLRVEFDHNGDGSAEGFALAGAGTFSYVPTGISPGQLTIRARAGQWNQSQSGFEFGEWTSLTFTLAFDPTDPPSVASLSLRFDTGTSNSDAITADPRIIGSVNNDGSRANLKVEFDHDGDGVIDGSLFTGNDGTFRYDAEGLQDGPVTIRARVREWEPAQSDYQFSEWVSISFTLDPTANSPAVLSGISLLHDTGSSSTDGMTRDLRLTGTASNDGDVLNLCIEFDHNGDGVADGSTLANGQGGFVYTPIGLEEGPVTIRVRTVELPPACGRGRG